VFHLKCVEKASGDGEEPGTETSGEGKEPGTETSGEGEEPGTETRPSMGHVLACYAL